MAKTKDGAKKGKAKIPKRIGGVKLPKELRSVGGKIAGAIASPAGRELIAAGLSMAAAAAAAAVEKERARRSAEAAAPGAQPPSSPAPPTPPPRAASATGTDPHEIGVQLGKLAEAALSGLFAPRKS